MVAKFWAKAQIVEGGLEVLKRLYLERRAAPLNKKLGRCSTPTLVSVE
jgi:hypothetical protein